MLDAQTLLVASSFKRRDAVGMLEGRVPQTGMLSSASVRADQMPDILNVLLVGAGEINFGE